VDAFLRQAVETFEGAFPTAVSGYYLIGSYADGSAVGMSDLDLVVLFKGHLETVTKSKAWHVGDALAARCPARLDLTISGDADPTWEKEYVRLASLFLYGEDVRNKNVLPSPHPGGRRRRGPSRVSMVYAARMLRELRGVGRLRFPLAFPDPSGAFYGYDVIRHPEWYPPGVTSGLRELVNAVLLVADALTPPGPNGEGARTKAQAMQFYRERVGGKWADYVEALYRDAKLRWEYLVPSSAAERTRLGALCEQTLGFENHFLARYRSRVRGTGGHAELP
jgi:hypothetical protein